jgi:hypothetical protein
MPGMWQRYHRRWRVATRERLDLLLLEVTPPLAALCPPATVIDKNRYSAFAEPRLIEHPRQRETDALIVSDPRPMFACSRQCWTRLILATGHRRSRRCMQLIRRRPDRDRRRRDNPRAVGMTSDRASNSPDACPRHFRIADDSIDAMPIRGPSLP